jgi:hypothetical protein
MVEAQRMLRLSILIAEDDLDDRFILKQAFGELGIGAELHFVVDGE